MNAPAPPPTVNDAELHALVDGQLTPERVREVETWLAQRPQEAQRVADYRAQRRALHLLFDPALSEVPPRRLLRAARPRRAWYRQRWLAGLALLLLGGAAGWGLRTSWPGSGAAAALPAGATPAFAQRAAIAHAVYSPELRRPVEVDAAHEEQLVTWLSKRMGTPMRPPQLQALGYALEGGRLLPGGEGPVAQFMYRDQRGSAAAPSGTRLTVYVTPEAAAKAGAAPPYQGFRFAREGAVNVFYWVDGPFGYAISAGVDRAELARVSTEIYRQLSARTPP
ncbi:MAG: anti-sigma factor [Burkholderiaceae bacterium]